MGLRAALALALAGAGMVGAGALARSPQGGPSPTPERLPLRYDAALSAADFPSPAARVTIGGKTAWILFDTGAGVHMLASWYTGAAGLVVEESPGFVARDSTDRVVALRVVRNITGSFDDGSPLRPAGATVAEFPPVFADHQIAGALSPQLLAAAGEAATLDLRVPELRFEPFDAAIERLGAAAFVPGTGLEVCREERAPLRNLLFALPTTVVGTKASMLLDSGAATTTLGTDSKAVKRLKVPLEKGASALGVGGVRTPVSMARGVTLRFGGHVRTIDVRVGPRSSATCGRDGHLGLDAIRECAFVLGERRLAMACGAAASQTVPR